MLLQLAHDLDGQGNETVMEMDDRMCSIIGNVTLLNIIEADVLLDSNLAAGVKVFQQPWTVWTDMTKYWGK